MIARAGPLQLPSIGVLGRPKARKGEREEKSRLVVGGSSKSGKGGETVIRKPLSARNEEC